MVTEERRVIWKCALKLGWNHVLMPGFVRARGVGFQGEQLYVWCLVNEGALEEYWAFFVALTGEILPSNQLGFSAGMAQSANGIVAHVFEGRE